MMNSTGMGKTKNVKHDVQSNKPQGRNKRNPGTLSLEPERDSPAITSVRKPPTTTNKYLAAIGQEEHDDPDKPSVKKRNKRTQQTLTPLNPVGKASGIGHRNLSQQPISQLTTESHPINWAPDPTNDKPFGQQIIGTVEHHKHKVDLSNYSNMM